ncbi:hypothetical protein SeLEV6574_g00460 [Synchytrium endobioticum]|uniref:Ribosomal biogenesis protein LAS1L n=1 Tax=Synchytrium endobioticum TaxID=286115 RepID=A0A507DHN1_9FUNG|nr:hypothetical protein SeLEV6574_g00460 [Synchytrium endobioticum]
MRLTARVVPWTSTDEWEFVKSLLYPPVFDAATVQKGVDHVRMWASRGNLPQAAEMTAMMAECFIMENHRATLGLRASADGEVGRASESILRLTYSMAVIRFVNGLVDASQTPGRLQSVASVAETLGIPLWMVDLRHAATHEHLPSLSLLKSAAQHAMRWLDKHYWSRQQLQQASNEYMEEQVPGMLSQYLEVIGCSGDGEATSNRLPADDIVVRLCGWAMSSESLRNRICVEVAKVLISEVSQEICDEDKTTWKPLLDKLGAECLEELFVVLYTELGGLDFRTLDNQVALAWCRYLIKTYLFAQHGLPNNIEIIEACLQRPNVFTPILLKDMVSCQPGLGPSLHPFIEYLDSVAKLNMLKSDEFGSTDEEEDSSDEDGSGEIKVLRSRAQQLLSKGSQTGRITCKETVNNAWNLAPAKSWRFVPIGLLPGGKVPNLSLPDPREINPINSNIQHRTYIHTYGNGPV